jgi:hypothetical protein
MTGAPTISREEMRLLRIGVGRFDGHVPAPTYPHDTRAYNRLWLKDLIDARGFVTAAGREAAARLSPRPDGGREGI